MCTNGPGWTVEPNGIFLFDGWYHQKICLSLSGKTAMNHGHWHFVFFHRVSSTLHASWLKRWLKHVETWVRWGQIFHHQLETFVSSTSWVGMLDFEADPWGNLVALQMGQMWSPSARSDGQRHQLHTSHRSQRRDTAAGASHRRDTCDKNTECQNWNTSMIDQWW